MDDVTDTVFRQVIAEAAAPDLFFTEFVNVDGLQSPGRQALLPKLQFSSKEQPIIAQIWGKKPENYMKTAQDLVEMGYGGIDLNMGCPDKAITKNGCCSALINDRELAAAIIKATKEGAAGRIPVSVKTRLGYHQVDFTWHEFLLQQDIAALTVHGRTKKEMSSVPARWGQIAEVRAIRDRIAPQTKIIGNGDVESRLQGLSLQSEHNLDGIMVGRGIFKDPYLFAKDSPWAGMERDQRIAMYRRHIELFEATWQHGERKLHTLNKFCKIYINGFGGAKELRDQLMRAQSTTELLNILRAA